MKMLFVKDDNGMVTAEPGVVYPHYLNVIGHKGEITQNALEEARLVFTQDLVNVVGTPLHLKLTRDLQYKLTNYPHGEGEPRRLDIGTAYQQLPGTAASRLGLI